MKDDDRVATARGLADQMFEADVRGRQRIETTGELALLAWQHFAVQQGNRGLYSVLEQCDRCAFAERWRELATIYAERGKPGVFEALARARPLPPAPPGRDWVRVGGTDEAPTLLALPSTAPPAPGELPED